MKQSKKLIFFLVCILIFFLVLNIYSFFKIWSIVEVREIDASIIVSDKIGFDVSKESLTFGEVLIGSSSSRQMSIENNFKFPIRIYVYGKGVMKKFIVNSVIKIDEGKSKDVKVTAVIPKNTNFGRYEGKVVFEIRRI